MDKSKYAIIDYRAGSKLINALSEYTEQVILTKKINTYNEIDGHADIQICKISDNEIICCPSCYFYYLELLKDVKIIIGQKEPGNKYPDDICYNLFCNQNIAVHNFKYSDSVILETINHKSLNKINVKQGYTKCSLCEVSENAFITDDAVIYSKLSASKYDVLLIEKGKVKLPGMNYGFIGGATGRYKNSIFFTGAVNSSSIISFCNKHNTDIIELSSDELLDVGSILFL